VTDDLQRLLPFSWRGISFPVSNVGLDFSHDLPVHKSPDVDGGTPEATGRNPLVVTAKAILRNGVYPGPSEKWQAGTLYPGVFRALIAACADRTTGDLVHPSLGTLKAKCQSLRSTLSATARDGEDLDLAWVICNDETDPLTQAAPVASMSSAAKSLDKTLAQVELEQRLKAGDLTPDAGSFSDLVDSITAVSDTAGLVIAQNTAKITRVFGAIDQVRSSLSRVVSTSRADALIAAQRLESAVQDVRTTLLTTKVVRTYVTTQTMTLSALTVILRAQITDLIRLNPDQVREPVVEERTPIRYYAAA
jgi:hypothetical protein